MKKNVKTILIVVAVILAVAVSVGGLILGGVIVVGEKRTASAQTIEIDETGLTAYKAYPQVYKTVLKSLYDLNDENIDDFYSSNGAGWNVYTVTVNVKNREDVAIVISNAKSQLNGTENIWVCAKTSDNDYVTVAPNSEGSFSFSVLTKGYDGADAVMKNLKSLNPSIVFAENPNAANQTFVKFDMTNADKFAIDINF